ncbi:MAG: lantibiotic dehydratase family protein, partial [Kofleriaceae bacterium]
MARSSPKSDAGYRASRTFLLRVPALPFDTLDGVDASRLRALAGDPYLRSALAIASPSFAKDVASWSNAAGGGSISVEDAWMRYVARMAARPTPFGLFAGIAAGEWKKPTTIRIAARDSHSRRSRLDVSVLQRACEAALQDRETRRRIRWRTNPTLHSIGGRAHYIVAESVERGGHVHLAALDRDDVVGSLAAFARSPRQYTEVAAHLCATHELSASEAEDLVDEVAELQILLPSIAVRPTADDPTATLIRELGDLGTCEAIVARLVKAASILDREDRGGPAPNYGDLRSALADSRPVSELVRVELDVRATVQLSGEIASELRRAISVLSRLPDRRIHADVWRDFTVRFRDRYQARSVPLNQVLDDETGIGFGDVVHERSSLTERLGLRSGDAEPGVTYEPGEALLGVYHRALATNTRIVNLSDADLESLSATERPLPDTVALFGEIAAASAADVDEGRFLVRPFILPGRTAALLPSRFSTGVAAQLVRELIDAEEASTDDIVAEVVHLPSSRGANLVVRSAHRAYEIDCLGGTSVDEQHRIDLDDLVLSIEDDRIVMRSRRLALRVIPVLSCAHNYEHYALPHYRFLCALAQQEIGVGQWDWGALAQAPFLPRVTYRRIVLATATWRFSPEDLAPLVEAVRDHSSEQRDERIRAAADALRRHREMPRWVIFADGDHELTVDLDNARSVSSLISLVASHPVVTVRERLSVPGMLCAEGADGHYATEFVVPFVRPKRTATHRV